MQILDLNEHGLPDLQFVLMVLALCTSDLETLNVPEAARRTVFDRCWALMHDTPPPERREECVLDLRNGTALTLDAMVAVIKSRDDLVQISLKRLKASCKANKVEFTSRNGKLVPGEGSEIGHGAAQAVGGRIP